MSMTETPLDPAKPKPRRPRRKKAPRAAAPKAVTGEFAGISVANCPAACTAERCIISGVNVCAHPAKGGLHASMQNSDTVRRLNDAKHAIGQQKLDLTKLT